MRIILEGPDGAGKTTIVNKLAKDFNLEIQHVSGRDPNNFDWYIETFKKDNVVFDRHFIGELIYPKVFFREQRLAYTEAQTLFNYAKEHNIIIIIITANEDDILRRFSEREELEDPRIIEHLTWTIQQFKTCARDEGLPIFNTSEASEENNYKKIKQYIEEVLLNA